jgi:hypothetical protein
VYGLNFLVFAIVQLIFAKIFPPIQNLIDLIRTGILAGLIAVPLFLAIQTVAWEGNRDTVIYYLQEKVLRK